MWTEREADGRTGITKVIGVFHEHANVPKNSFLASWRTADCVSIKQTRF
jgi:hypothetical protein